MAVADRAHGYVTEVTYPFHYYRELNPHIQALTLTLAGVTPPLKDGRFTYIELGCGLGLATLVHAAANPDARFIATDIIPEHIAIAGGIAKQAGLDNVEFLEQSFEDLAGAGLPKCDFVTMHGVWSWINDLNRDLILKFVDRNLNPGGAMYVSYNAQPGHGAIMALREAMMVAYRGTEGRVEHKVEAALLYGHKLRQLNAKYFQANPLVGKYLDDITPLAPNYLAHEYFNADWWPFFFRQVAAQVAPLGLTFGTSAHVMDSLESALVDADMRTELNGLSNVTDRETIKDVLVNRQFRRDLFLRDAVALKDEAAAFDAMPFASAVLPQNVERVVGPGGIAPETDVARAIATIHLRGPASVATMATQPECAAFSADRIRGSLLIMAALGAAEPALPQATLDQRKARCGRLNEILWDRAARGDDVSATAVPVTGGAVGLSKAEQLFLLGRMRGQDPVELVMKAIPGQERGGVQAALETFTSTRIPLLRNLGVI